MKKPTTLRTLIFVLALLFNFASYAQNGIAFNSKLNSSSNENLFLKANSQFENQFGIDLNEPSFTNKVAAPIIVNPVIKYAKSPYAGIVSICANDGKELPKLFLCGSNDSRLIETGITNATSIVWQRRTGGCAVMANSNCANESPTCTWTNIANGPDYSADTAGEFRVRISYFDATVQVFYFNVYKNDLDPTGIIKSDILKSSSCTIPGRITAGGFNSDYEYSFTTGASAGTWQDSNTFPVSTAGTYNVFIRLRNVTGSCIFNVKNIVVKSLTFSSTLTATQLKCSGDTGGIKITTNDTSRQYNYIVTKDGAAFGTYGPMSIPEYPLNGLAPGVYTVVTSVEGNVCVSDTKSITINNISPLAATLGTTTGTTCTEGNIQVDATGGTAPYEYFVSINGGTSVSNGTNNIIAASTLGSYSIRIVDSKLCEITKTTNVTVTKKPDYTIVQKNQDCNGGLGSIVFQVNDAHGYNVRYSIDNGQNYSSTSSYTNLKSGDYFVSVRYRTGNNGSYCYDNTVKITILGNGTLTASAGVAALAGCNTEVGKENFGLLRITNPQGGVAPFKYSFDGKINWVDTKEMWVTASTAPYTLYIKDALGCEYEMKGIQLDFPPTKPEIKLSAVDYNCDGSGTATATVTNNVGPGYAYQYTLDGAINTGTPANVFKNIPVGLDHIIGVDYKLLFVPTYSNLLKEDFGNGDPTTTSGIASAYCFNDLRVNAPYLCNFPDGTPGRSVEDNAYSVTSDFWRSDDKTGNNSGAWFHFKDHTTNPNNLTPAPAGANPKGRYLLVNIGSAAGPYGVLYSKPIADVIPNQPVIVDVYVANLLNKGTDGAAPIVRFELEDAAGNVVATADTGKIAEDKNDPNRQKWVPVSLSLDPGNNTNLKFVIRSGSLEYNGNDLVIDDIWVRQLPKSCVEGKTFRFDVLPNKAFTAKVENIGPVSCNGGADGKFQIIAENFDPLAGFEYSLDGGGNWYPSTVGTIDFPNATFPNITAKTYDIRVRNKTTGTPCNFTIPTTVPSPAKFTVSAVATAATCTAGAVVTATVGGGVGPYTVTLTSRTDGTVITLDLDPIDGKYKKAGVKADTYVVSGIDAKTCASGLIADLVVTGTVAPSLDIKSDTGLCFLDGTGATITIEIKDGLGPFTYKVSRDGGLNYEPLSAPFNNRIFTHHAPTSGTYDFIVYDDNGCNNTAVSQTINPQFGATPKINNALSCKTAGTDAIIEVTIDGGTAPYTYTIKNSTGTILPGGATINTASFQYTTGTADTYTFDITDKNGCPISITQKVDALVRPTAEATPHNPLCNGGTGSVDLKGVLGKAPFLFQLDGTGAFTGTTNYTNLTASAAGTTHSYIVRDANDCETSYDFKLFEPAVISGTATVFPVYNCDQPATITVSNVLGGTPAYKYTLLRDGVAVEGPQDANTFTGINVAGIYTVRITDVNSCFIVISAGTINALDKPNGMTITTTTAATCPTNQGSVTITDVVNAANALVPTAGLEYRIVLPTATAFQTSNVFNNLDANVKYTFEVRDANKCTTQKDHTILLPQTFTVGGTPKSVTCFSATDGSISFTVTGIAVGTSYSYTVDSGAVLTGTAATNPFTISAPNLGAGSHSITVTNSTTKCPITETVTVGGPAAALALNAPDLTHVTCLVKGTATINAVNGSGSYTYTVTPTLPAGTAKVQANDNKFINLDAGTYSVSVSDLTGCTVAGQTFIINGSVNPAATISGTSSYCAGGAGATLIATPTVAPQPNPNYEYSLDGVTYQSSGSFSGLTPGKYTITVKDIVTGCTTVLAEQTITEPLSAKADPLVKDLDCDATNPNAVIKIVISNGYPDYTYRVSTNGSTYTGTPIPVGAGLNSFTHTTTTGAAAATYEFEIFDSKGCRTTVTQDINARTTPTAVTVPTNPTCFNGSNGSIEVNPSAGLAPYTYEVSTTSAITGFSPMLTNTLSGASATTYWFRVTDAKKCQVVVSRTLTNPTELTAHADVTKALTCGAGNAAQSAEITVTIDKIGTPYTGVNKYRYSYNGVLPAVISNTYTTTTAGVVTVDVFDANGCSFRVLVSPEILVLDPPTNMTFDAPAAISCESGKDKTDLTVKVDNGVAPFKFEITSTDATVAPAAPVATGVTTQDHTFTNLAPGTYHFKVTDANLCTTTGDFKIDDVLPLFVNGSVVSNVSCKGSSDGKLTFTVSGNSGTFTYELRNAANALIPIGQSVQTGNVIDYTGLPAAIYTITITNPVTKCIATKALEVKEAAVQLAFNAPTITPITCAPNNGKVVINTVGGWGNNKYTLTLPDGTVVGPQANATFSNLTQSGTYGISVTDLNGNGCTIATTFNVAAAIQPDASIDLTNSDLCYDEAGKATIIVTPAAVSPDYRYNINDGAYQVSGTFTDLDPGNYVVKVKDIVTGCILTLPAQTIEKELKFDAKLETLANCTGQDIEIKGTVSGGKTPYTYTVTINGTLDPTVRPVTGTTFTYTDNTATTATTATTYLFTLSDDSTTHCSLTSTVIVAPKTDPEFTLTPNSTILCNGDATGSITVTIDATKGASPYVINVTKDNSLLVPPVANVNYGTQTTGLPAGTYIVRVTDNKGCFLDKTTVIIDPPKIDFKLVDVQIKCTGTGGTIFGSISVTTLTGGSINTLPAASGYIYTLTSNTSPTQTFTPVGNEDHTFNILNFGIYELTVQDKNGCSLTKKINMASPPEDLDIQVTPGPASCTTASLIVKATPSIPGGPYVFAKYPLDPLDPNKYDYATYSALYQNADALSPPAAAGDPLLLQSTFNNLNPGVIYSFVVYDKATQCYYFKQADAPTKTASALVSTVTPENVTCTGAGDGKVTFTFSATKPTTTEVRYDIYNSQTNLLVSPAVGGTVVLPLNGDTAGPLAPGTYYILFKELDTTTSPATLVCVNSSKVFTISQSVVPLSLTANSTQNDNCGSLKGIVEAFGQGGTTTKPDVTDPTISIPVPYLYQIFKDDNLVGVIDGTDHSNDPAVDPTFRATFDVDGQTSNTFKVDDGDYIVYVRDANGCVQYAFVKVLLDPTPVITAVTNDICVTEGSFAIDVKLTTAGIAPHYYSLDGTGFVLMPSANFSIPNLSSGNHTVEVQDRNGCGNKVTLNLISVPLTIKASFTTDPKCLDNSGEITAIVTGGETPNNFEYTLVNNTVPATPNVVQMNDGVFAGQAAGNYTVTVKDVNTTCTRSVTVDLLVPTDIDLLPTDISTTAVDCSGTQGTTNNGTLTVNLTAVNDNPNYTFVLTPVLPAGTAITQPNNNVFTGLSAGDYTVTVISSRGCEKTVAANVPAPSLVVATADAAPFSCAVDPTVTTVVVTGSGGTGAYTFSKDGINYFASNSLPADKKYTFELSDTGSVQNPTYWVKDANGCLVTTTLTTALNPLPKLISATAKRSTAAGSQIDCVNGREVIQIDVVGGSTTPIDLKYEVSIDGLPYTLLAASSGSTTFTYNALTAGSDYQFKITDNATGCDILTNVYNVPLFDALEVTAKTFSDAVCKTETNGSIEINISGYTGIYTYAIYNGATPVIGGSGTHDTATSNPFVLPVGLGAGTNYTVRVVETGYPRCNTTSNVVIISEPAAALALDPLDVTPLGCTTDGAVTVTAQGGWGNNVYTLTPPSGPVVTNTDGIFGGLRLDGLYTVTVKDANGCIDTDTFNLVIPTPPTATIAATSDYCYDETDRATLIVDALGGAGGYEYSIDNGQNWTTNNTFDKLTPGSYDIIVRDAYGCEVTVSNNVIKGQIFASAKKDTEIFCGPTDGLIKLEVIGGYAPFSYTVTKNGTLDPTVIAFPTPTATTADFVVDGTTGAGDYVFTITDAHSCPSTTTLIHMTNPTPVTYDVTPTSPSCDVTQGNGANGQILVELTGPSDNGPYIFTLTPPVGLPVTQTSNGLFTGLPEGTYSVTVTSARSCPVPQTGIIIAPPALVVADAKAAPFKCTSANVVKETIVTVTGDHGAGVEPITNFTYSENGTDWKTFNEFKVFNDPLAVQHLTYYVRDLKGCIDSFDIDINPFPELVSADAALLVAADCPNLGIETIKVDIVGGTGSYSYQVSIDGAPFSTPATPITTGATFNYPAPAGHSYQFNIIDVNTTCSILTNVHDVPLYNIMTVTATPSLMVSCNGLSNGNITINIENYIGLYDYTVLLAGNPVAVATGSNIDAAANNPYVITGLAAGVDYEVKVTQLGYPRCDVTSNKVTITQPSALNLAGMKVAVVNQNCNNIGATITVDPTSITGGTGTYEYAFVPAGNTPINSDYKPVNIKTFATTQIAPLFDSYDVYVRDQNGCPDFRNVHISVDPMPVIDNVTVDSQCASTTGYKINVFATGLAKLRYSLDGVQFQDDNFFIVKNAGNYTVTVQDKNQCEVTAGTAFTILEPLALSAKINVVPTCTAADGEVTLTASGGTVTTPSSYVYIKDGGAPQPSPVFSGLAPGTYIFTVRDIVELCTKDITVVIDNPVLITGMVATPTPVSCNGGSNGSISVAIGDTSNPIYRYTVAGPITVGPQDSPIFNNLPYGNYTVTVVSGKGCSDTRTVLVDQPQPIAVTANATEFGCTTGTNTTNNAVVTVTNVTGGSGNYLLYQFMRNGVEVQKTDSNVYTEFNHAGGNYVVNVFDDKNCQGTTTTPITIAPFATIDDISFDVKTPITCVNPETLQVNVTTTGTLTTPLSYTLAGINGTAYPAQTNNTGLFLGLGIGDYEATVSNSATGCSLRNFHYVVDPNTFAIAVNPIQSEICYGTTVGQVELTFVDNQPNPTNDAGAFTYTITGPATNINASSLTAGPVLISGLGAGLYTVSATLSNLPSCTVTTTFQITQAAKVLDIEVFPGRITCAANNNGSIGVTATGGWPGDYQYELVGPVSHIYSEVSFFDNLTPGMYTVNVKDSKGCIDSDVVNLVIPTPIAFTATPSATTLSCFGATDGSITVSAPTGGEGTNYLYTLSYTAADGTVITTGPQESNVFTDLGAGNYTVKVTDGFSCEATSAVVTIANPVKIDVLLSLESATTCFSSAQLTLNVVGGTAPYTYSEDGVNFGTSFNSSITFPATVGTHRYYVKDNLGCTVLSNEQKVEPVTPLTIELDATNAKVNCKGDSSAIINAVAKGGLGNYEYSLLQVVGGVSSEIRAAQPDGIFADLAAGTYKVHVKSGDCEKDVDIVVTEAVDKLVSSYVVTPVKCFGEKSGSIAITASGGTGVIKYAISPNLDQFLDSGLFEGLVAGTYKVIVQDVLGCTNIYDIIINEPTILIASEIPGSMIPEICKGDNDGAFSVQISGGTSPYYESLDKANGPYNLVTGNEKDYTNLAGGKHTVFIKDTNGCISEVEIKMPEPVVLNPIAEVTYDCVNNMQANMVTITVDASNTNPADVDYSLDNNGTYQPSNIFTNVTPGDHFVTARHTNGCEVQTAVFNVKTYQPLTLAEVRPGSISLADANIIEVVAGGGSPAYEYSFNGEAFTSSNKYKIYKTGVYVVVVRDQNGCTATINVDKPFVDICMPDHFTPNGDGQFEEWGPDCTLIYDKLTFDIFDRYGRVVAKYHYGEKWNGKYNGEELPTGDYWYVVKLNDPKDNRSFVGHFTLYR